MQDDYENQILDLYNEGRITGRTMQYIFDNQVDISGDFNLADELVQDLLDASIIQIDEDFQSYRYYQTKNDGRRLMWRCIQGDCWMWSQNEWVESLMTEDELKQKTDRISSEAALDITRGV